MKDDPSQIAEHLVEQHGFEDALHVVRDGIATAHEIGDKYGLSIWREVRRALQDKRDAAKNEEASVA